MRQTDDILSGDIDANDPHAEEESLTLGEKAADWVAEFGGSWAFIISFFAFIIAWMLLNVVRWITHWDAPPYILLNLILSCLASIQAPIIMMSQNRQGEKDRQRAIKDYHLNRKAEEEVRDIRAMVSTLLETQAAILDELQNR